VRAGAWGALVLVGALVSGCFNFSTDDYCARHPELCEFQVTELTPTHGPAEGGTTVSLAGAAFSPDTIVEVGGVPAQTNYSTPARLTFVTPPGTGVKDITLRGKYTSLTLPAAFRYSPPPQVTRFEGSRGSSLGGTPVRLTGLELGPDLVVRIGGSPVVWESGAYDELGQPQTWIGRTSPGEPGVHDVEISTRYGSVTLPGAFTYVVPWTDVGPGLHGPGAISAVAGDPAGGVVLAARQDGGLFRTTDQGRSWTAVRSIPSNVNIQHLLVDPVTGFWHAASSTDYFRSRDRGQTWTAMNDGLKGAYHTPNVRSLRLSPDGTVYALDSSNIYRLSPGSSSWRSYGFGYSTHRDIALGATRVYVTDGEYVSWWDEAWRSWVMVTSRRTITALLVVPGDPDILYVAGPDGLARLPVGGTAWTQLHPGPVVALARAPSSGRLLIATSSEIRASDDSGATWTPVGSLPDGLTFRSLGSSGPDVLVATDQGVAVHSPGGAFELRTAGMSPRVESVAIDPADRSHLYVTTPVGLFQSRDGGGSWLRTPLGAMPAVLARVDPRMAGRAFAVTGEGLWRTTDSGVSWARVGPARKIRDLAVSRVSPGTLYLTAEDGIWRSADAGETWNDFGDGSSEFRMNARNVVAGITPEETVYATQFSRDVLYARTPGTPWTGVAGGLAGPPESLSVDPATGAVLFSGGNLHVRTPDGRTYRLAPPSPAHAVAFADAGTGRMFLAADAGPFRAELGPLTSGQWTGRWYAIGTGLPASQVLAFATDPVDDGIVYAGTVAGLYKSTIGGL
jgi:photosystem II stability/assembly factor-like uncharacterized protein